MTTTFTPEALAAATLPYALTGLGNHLHDHRLPAPERVAFDHGRITLAILGMHEPAWRRTADFGPVTRKVSTSYTVNTSDVVLHGSCVEVTLRWLDLHPRCTSLDDCRAWVLPADGIEPGCPHGDMGSALCADHRDQCSLCRDDMRQDRAEGWDR